MKQLFLIRHAKSSWNFPELTDKQRPLNQRGERDAPFMSNLLQQQGVQPDLMMSSPAVRALTTATIFAQTLGYEKTNIEVRPEIYEANIGTFFGLLRALPEAANTVFLFGHNPTITVFASIFTDKNILNVPTCGIIELQSEAKNWADFSAENTVLTRFDFPKNYFK